MVGRRPHGGLPHANRRPRGGLPQGGVTQGSASGEKVADDGTKGVHVHNNRVRALDRVELRELRIRADRRNALGQFALLVNREQEVGANAHYERPFQVQTLEAGLQRPAVLGEVKEI